MQVVIMQRLPGLQVRMYEYRQATFSRITSPRLRIHYEMIDFAPMPD